MPPLSSVSTTFTRKIRNCSGSFSPFGWCRASFRLNAVRMPSSLALSFFKRCFPSSCFFVFKCVLMVLPFVETNSRQASQNSFRSRTENGSFGWCRVRSFAETCFRLLSPRRPRWQPLCGGLLVETALDLTMDARAGLGPAAAARKPSGSLEEPHEFELFPCPHRWCCCLHRHYCSRCPKTAR